MERRLSLSNQIRSSFLVAYGHFLTAHELDSLVDKLVKAGISAELIAPALGADSSPQPHPDNDFDPKYVFRLWQALHSVCKYHQEDILLQVFCKAIIYPHLIEINKHNAAQLAAVFATSSANLPYTRFLYAGFLGRSEFEMARRVAEKDLELANRYYRRCIERFDRAKGLGIRQDKHHYGMAGVAHFFLAKSASGEEKQDHLQLAISNLQTAEDLGDKTKEHFDYFGRTYFELAKETSDLSIYQAALDKFQKSFESSLANAESASFLAKAHRKIGMLLDHQSKGSGSEHLKEAVRLYGLLDSYMGSKSYPREFYIGDRAQAHLELWYSAKDAEALNNAISDFGTLLESDVKRWRHAMANALFERYLSSCGPETDLKEAKNLNDQEHQEGNVTSEHLKQRGRIYGKLGVLTCEPKAFDEAVQSFRGLVSSDDPEIPSYLGAVYANRGLLVGDEGDLRQAARWLESRPDLLGRDEGPIGLLPKVYRRLAMMIGTDRPDEALSFLDKSIVILKSIPTHELKKDRELREYFSILGTTYRERFDFSERHEDIQNARKYLEKAALLGMTGIELFGRLGDACLQVGKLTKDVEDQLEAFAAAADCFERSRTSGNEEAANYSKLGEAYLRLHKVKRDRGSAEKALSMFLESVRRGNDSQEIQSLIGDCYYHLSRYGDHITNLEKAIEWKSKARELGPQSREHFSVSGKIHLLLYDELRREDDLISGVKLACEAAKQDPAWPWPVCQLAEVSEKYGSTATEMSWESEGIRYPDTQIWEFFVAKRPEALWKEGAERVLRSSETREKVLGGKSHVWVEEDKYGLISDTFVFKPSMDKKSKERGRRALEHEYQRTTEMKAYLSEAGEKRFVVPSPIGILSLEGLPIYAMHRAHGRNLSDLILHGPRNRCDKAMKDTVEFLALYHAWDPILQREEYKRQAVAKVQEDLEGSLRLLGESSREVLDAVQPVFSIIEQLPVMRYKDAHPDNWIILNDGRILMIDLEASRPSSMPWDLVKLLEDQPYIQWDTEGWCLRKKLIQSYLEHYEDYRARSSKGTPEKWAIPSLELMVTGYLSFVTILGLWGLGFATRKKGQAVSLSGREQWEARKAHYVGLVKAVPEFWQQEELPFKAPSWDQLARIQG